MILPQTRRCTEIKMFDLRPVCVKRRQEALLSAPRWQPERESMFANLYSYLIWSECRSHSPLVTENGANTKAKWTNRRVVCEPHCLQALSVLLLICLIMHPESILQLMSDWSWCVHVSVCTRPCVFACVLFSGRATDSFLRDPCLSWKSNAMETGALLC